MADLQRSLFDYRGGELRPDSYASQLQSQQNTSAYAGVGQNPVQRWDFNTAYSETVTFGGADERYPWGDTVYNFDTKVFGAAGAASYGAAFREAIDNGFNQMYGGVTPGVTIGSGTQQSLNIIIDPDLANKQAEEGTTAWFLKIYRDLTAPPMPMTTQMWADQSHDQFISTWDRNASKALIGTLGPNERLIGNNIMSTHGGTPSDYLKASYNYQGLYNEGSQYQVGYQQGPTKPIGSGYYNPGDYLLGGGYFIREQTYAAEYGNKPNVNLYGGNAYNPFNQNETLAPTSISQGRGIMYGPTHQINTQRSEYDWKPTTTNWFN